MPPEKTLHIMQNIPDSEDWRVVESLTGGFSQDEKFKIAMGDGNEALLVLADIQAIETKCREFDLLSQVKGVPNLPVPRPIAFGTTEDERGCYEVLSWMPGKNAKEEAAHVDSSQLYDWGVTAGKYLRRLHEATCISSSSPLREDIGKTLKRKCQMYISSGLEWPEEEEIMAYLNELLPEMKILSQCWLHGDFHLGNLVVDDRKTLSIIDFNRCRIGAPVQDFCRMAVYSRPISTDFCRGQIAGYCGDTPTEAFWRQFAFFAVFEAFFNLLWMLPYGKRKMEEARLALKMVLKDFNYLESPVPRWMK